MSPPTGRPQRTPFTAASIKKMHSTNGKIAEWQDGGCNGLTLRAMPSGKRSWSFRYRDEHGKDRRQVIGDASAISLDDARKAARVLAAKVAQGGNPSAERRARRGAATVKDVIDRYLPHAEKKQRPKSYTETKRYLENHAADLHREPVETVRRGHISSLLDKIEEENGPIAANRCRAALSAMWNWGIMEGHIVGANGEDLANPIAKTQKRGEQAKDRVLSDAEIRVLWDCTGDDTDHNRIVRLLLLTGCRKGEVGGLSWSEIDSGWITIPRERMKGAQVHEVPVLPAIQACLPAAGDRGHIFGRNGTGFSGWSKCKERLDARMLEQLGRLPPWGLHDCRRTMSTRLNNSGVDPLVVEALLAHKPGGVAGVYDRATRPELKIAALKRWHGILSGVIGDGWDV